MFNIFKGLRLKEVEGFNKHAVAKLEHADLPELSFRCDHPKYLRMKKLEQRFLQLFHLNVDDLSPVSSTR